MSQSSLQSHITHILKEKAGIIVNGSQPWDITVHDEAFWDILAKDGSLGLGESYMSGLWDCTDLETFFYHILRNKIQDEFFKNVNISTIIDVIKAKLRTSRYDAYEVGTKHYDIGNDLYGYMLGETRAYSCGYFKDTEDLTTAQYQKFDLICQKLQLKKGETLLDIGCGWGMLMKYAVEKYGVRAVGLTVSREQYDYITNLNLEDISVYMQDYKTCDISSLPFSRFDKIVSVGMFEHVNRENYDTFMQFCDTLLVEGGLFLLHTIGDNTTNDAIEPWIAKYIFPNSKLPSNVEILQSSEARFIMEDWHNFGYYYHKTLHAWWNNFYAHWESDLKSKYDTNSFYRMWEYYLKSTSGAFKARHIQLWQIVFSKKFEGIYHSIR